MSPDSPWLRRLKKNPFNLGWGDFFVEAIMTRKSAQSKKILVAMSGGVDSSVVAARLVRAGHDVTGVFVINYDAAGPNCWLPDYRDAVRVAAHLGIPLLRWNCVAEYREHVLNYLYAEYAAGRTPNPDVLCNQYVKFGVWFAKARALGFDYVATGHYAQAKNGQLLKAKDSIKDQTYFLHQVSREALEKTLFPIGDLTKPQVRALAKKWQLPTAQKGESMGICFVGEVPMKEFLAEKIKRQPGPIMTDTGLVVGEHSGLAFYTIGQRHQLGDSATVANQGAAWYVIDKRSKDNTLVVGDKNHPKLQSRNIQVSDIHWIGAVPTKAFAAQVRLRHRGALHKAQVVPVGAGWELRLVTPEWAVAPGQFAVIYKGQVCLGGGAVAQVI